MPVAVILVFEDAVRCEQSQHAVKSIGVYRAGISQVRDRYRAISDAIGNAEIGDQMEAPRYEAGGGQPPDALVRVLSHCQSRAISARPRCKSSAFITGMNSTFE
jgi:hypothetical protein